MENRSLTTPSVKNLFHPGPNNDKLIKKRKVSAVFSTECQNPLLKISLLLSGLKSLTDQEGNTWDVTGKAIDGPRKGEKLEPVKQIMGYWFGFAAFYPEIELY
ncbi:MAG: DUF3179 domain-containing (seleno)protein [Bacteroidota bacterium]